MNPSYRAIVFDFDYTLADSSPGIVACTNHALGAMGLPRVPEADICRTIGLSLPVAFGHYAGDDLAHRAPEFQAHFVRRADEIMVAHTALLPGVPEAVRRLKSRGLRLGIVTTKYRYRIEAVLQRDGLEELFDTVIGLEDVERPKPDPQGLIHALGTLDAPPAQALYVGDSPMDAQTARSADVPFVAVLSGPTPAEAFAPYTPVAVLNAVTDLPDWTGP